MGKNYRVSKALRDFVTETNTYPDGRRQGKNRRGGGGGGRGGGQPGGGWPDRGNMVKENQKFQSFYDTLLQLPDEEKQQYWDALKRELPNSFRFCGHKGYVLP